MTRSNPPSITQQRSLFHRMLALSICICILLIPSAPFLRKGVADSVQQNQGLGGPRPGKPEAVLPNLDTVRTETPAVREPVLPIPSTMRSRKNPLKPWDGRRVGDPLPTIGMINAPNKINKNSNTQRPETNAGISQRAHATHRASAAFSMSDDALIDTFYYYALPGYTPLANEKPYWRDQLRVGLAHGQESLRLAAIEMGKTLFESAAYAARNRDNYGYVYDLFETYLNRDPDPSGWAYWEGQVPLIGRENVRRGFEESTGFANLIATVTPNGSASSNPVSLITSRVDPRNEPGNGMLTRDATWSVPLLSLPGRAGLDLGLTLSYSSHVWTTSGPFIYFDEDNGFPSPGFRLGFPTVQRKTFDAQTNTNTYLLLTPAGHRVELRQVGTSNIYEAGDSSHLQLTDNGTSWLVRSTDGTQLTFTEQNNEYHCTQIKDRNGNYMTVNYDSLGHILTIADTLGRVITFNYDGNANLLTITQSWNGQTHQWVSFGWTNWTMQSSFSNAALIGTANNTLIPVINQVNLTADGSTFLFDYTNSIQVSAVTRKSFDNVQRSQTTFTYDVPTNDVPRLTYSNVAALNWTGINGVPAQVTTHFEVMGDGACAMTAPDGTIFKEYYGTGWQKGLTTSTEVWAGGVKQKWTTTAWTQDNTAVSYQTNPRVTETNVYDVGGNRRRTVIEYGPYAQWGLPYGVREYANDGQTELRQTWTDYNLSQSYVDRRIIGLVSYVHMSNVAQWQSKISYSYDNPSQLQSLPSAATQHDPAYSASFTTRGNLTAVSHWDITDIGNSNKALTTQLSYNEAGAVVSASDPLGHINTLSYADVFSDNGDRHTFAYPTTATDAGNFSSTVQYNFDFGAITRKEGPPPAGQSQGAIQTMSYYSNTGQLERVTTVNTGAYKRFWYGPNYTASYTTMNSVADEAYAIEVSDGVGRVIGAASNHPGSAGGYRLVVTIYDRMGRAVQQSNPTEIDNSWEPKGEDRAGVYYTNQTYDWKGRPLRTTHPDATYKEVSYNGCGCAGGEVVTLTDEMNRQQKVYSDVLGRTWKTEIMSWPDANQNRTTYSTTVSVYNVRDQVTNVKEYAGLAPADASSINAAASCPNPSNTCQETLMAYDGYGRLQSKHVPEQNVGSVTTYSYYTDDTVNSITDARGAVTTYGYNSRHLVTSINYSAPAGITATPTVSFNYDSAGNRTLMTDGQGNTAYFYDQLSRLTSEKRHINGLASLPTGGDYTLSYQYNLADELSSVTDPWGAQVGYTRDATGRTTAVTSSGYGDITSYASNFQYRAWGGLKHLTYRTGRNVDVTYNSRMQAATFGMSNPWSSYHPMDISMNYQRYADGKLRYSQDLTDGRFDRSYSFDHAGRLMQALSGPGARGEPDNDNRPFTQGYSFDVWNNMTSRTGRHWTHGNFFSTTYVNNRMSGWQYDADGRTTVSNTVTSTYDAAGQLAQTSGPQRRNNPPLVLTQSYDGDGRRVKDTEYGGSWYWIYSTALGGKMITEIYGTPGTSDYGRKWRGYVYANGAELAQQNPTIYYEAFDSFSDDSGSYLNGTQLDPLGNDVGTENPYTVEGGDPGFSYPSFGDVGDYAYGCTVDRDPWPCFLAFKYAALHSVSYNSPGRYLTPFPGLDFGGGILTRIYGSGSLLLDSDSQQNAKGNYTATVTVAPDESGDSWAWQPLPSNPLAADVTMRPLLAQLPPPNIAGIRKGLQEALKRWECREFIQNMLDAVDNKKNPVAKSGVIMDLFDAVVNQGGITRTPPPGSAGYGNPTGKIKNNNAAIFSAVKLADPSLQLLADIHTTLHELLHLAGYNHYYTDEEFAKAVHNNQEYQSRSPYPPDDPALHQELNDPNALGWGAYWNDVLMQKCFQ